MIVPIINLELRELCRRVSVERNPEKFSQLALRLMELLGSVVEPAKKCSQGVRP